MRMLIESWKAQRAMLARQLEMFENGEMRIGADDRNIVLEETRRLTACTPSWMRCSRSTITANTAFSSFGITAL